MAEPTPPLPTAPGLPDLLHVAGVLLLLVAALFAVMWLVRRYGHRAGLPGFARGGLALEGMLGLGPRKSVVAVRFLNKRLLLGVTETHITLLTQAEIDDERAAPGHAEEPPFAETLRRERG